MQTAPSSKRMVLRTKPGEEPRADDFLRNLSRRKGAPEWYHVENARVLPKKTGRSPHRVLCIVWPTGIETVASREPGQQIFNVTRPKRKPQA